MKRFVEIVVSVLVVAMSSWSQSLVSLGVWRYAEAGVGEWRACSVPSLVQECLLRDGLLPPLHCRCNEDSVQWVSERDWLYEVDFDLSAVELGRKYLVLELDGVDTYSEVYVNGQSVGRTDNMFVAYRFDVKPYARLGQNTLRIHLKSPLKMAKPLQERAGFNYPADNDHAPIRYSPFTRKAPYHYGWDWGMRLLSMGLWQGVRLRAYDLPILRELDVESDLTWRGDVAEKAVVRLKAKFDGDAGPPLGYRVELMGADGEVLNRFEGQGAEALNFEIPRPHLWWPYAWGEPYLYTIRLSVAETGQVVERQLGLRSLRLVHQPNRPVGESSFYFEVNKRPLFVRGANYVPSDNLLTRRSDEDFRRLFEDAKFAHMNMLRVWGGGVYEDERFYDEADRQGILIWQDFMFACTAYPADTAFLSSVGREAEYQVQRLKHHPSIALWCGNNEVEEALRYWGWQRKYKPEEYARMQADYNPLFRELLPEIVGRIDPQRAYIHSSPTSANWGRPTSWLEGDSHYWGLWYGEEPFDTFEDKIFAFVSEFGFQSFPDVPSLRQFAEAEDMGLETEVMRKHQKASTGNGLIRKYMEREYKVPERFEDFVYVGQVMQARGMEQAIRAMRRHRPTTMGALVWQLNDAWPAVSWSSIDYYGNYKALHYRLRDAFDPIALIPRRVGDKLELYWANDGREPINERVHLSVGIHTFERDSCVYVHEAIRNEIPANGIERVLTTEDIGRYLSRRDVYYNIELIRSKKLVKSLKWYAHPTKDLQLPKAEYSWKLVRKPKTTNEYTLTIKAETFVKDLWISSDLMGLRMSDNLLDMMAGEVRKITIRSAEPLTKAHLHLRAMND